MARRSARWPSRVGLPSGALSLNLHCATQGPGARSEVGGGVRGVIFVKPSCQQKWYSRAKGGGGGMGEQRCEAICLDMNGGIIYCPGAFYSRDRGREIRFVN